MRIRRTGSATEYTNHVYFKINVEFNPTEIRRLNVNNDGISLSLNIFQFVPDVNTNVKIIIIFSQEFVREMVLDLMRQSTNKPYVVVKFLKWRNHQSNTKKSQQSYEHFMITLFSESERKKND